MESEGRIIVDAMNAMEYDAMTVGSMDLLKGIDVLLQRAKEARFAVLSCNLVQAESEEPILLPYTILERDGMRYGILGVSEVDLFRSPSLADEAKVLDPLISVRKYLPEVRSQSDVVIVLSHLGVDEDEALAQAVPGIDIIVGGKSRKLMSTPLVVGDTIIVQMGYDGEWLGKLEIDFDQQWRVLNPKEEIITLDPEVADDAELKALVAEYEERYPAPTPSQGS